MHKANPVNPTNSKSSKSISKSSKKSLINSNLNNYITQIISAKLSTRSPFKNTLNKKNLHHDMHTKPRIQIKNQMKIPKNHQLIIEETCNPQSVITNTISNTANIANIANITNLTNTITNNAITANTKKHDSITLCEDMWYQMDENTQPNTNICQVNASSRISSKFVPISEISLVDDLNSSKIPKDPKDLKVPKERKARKDPKAPKERKERIYNPQTMIDNQIYITIDGDENEANNNKVFNSLPKSKSVQISILPQAIMNNSNDEYNNPFITIPNMNQNHRKSERISLEKNNINNENLKPLSKPEVNISQKNHDDIRFSMNNTQNQKISKENMVSNVSSQQLQPDSSNLNNALELGLILANNHINSSSNSCSIVNLDSNHSTCNTYLAQAKPMKLKIMPVDTCQIESNNLQRDELISSLLLLPPPPSPSFGSKIIPDIMLIEPNKHMNNNENMNINLNCEEVLEMIPTITSNLDITPGMTLNLNINTYMKTNLNTSLNLNTNMRLDLNLNMTPNTNLHLNTSMDIENSTTFNSKENEEDEEAIKQFNQYILTNPITNDIYYDIFQHMLTNEQYYKPDPYYFKYKQHELNSFMRSILLDWMMEVCSEFDLKRETFHIACNYVDRYLSYSYNIKKGDLQLVGIAAMIIASKMEEVISHRLCDFAKSADDGYTIQQILDMEIKMYQVLNWQLTPTTIFTWANWYMLEWDNYLDTSPIIIQTRLINNSSNSNNELIYFKHTNRESYTKYRELLQMIDASILNNQTLQYKNQAIIASFLYLIIGKYYKQFTLNEIIYEIPISNYFLYNDTQGLNYIFKDFLNICFGYRLEDLLSTIQYIAKYFTLQISYELPHAAKINPEYVLKGHYEEFLCYQTYSTANLKLVKMMQKN